MTDPDTLDHVVREAEGDPQGALILLHGRGADERDLLPLLDVIDPDKRLVGLTPGGPLHPPAPATGRSWYKVPQVGFPDPTTFHAVYALLQRFLDGWLQERAIGWDRTIIGGFSMGCVMSYALGLGPGRPKPAGILAMSGFVPTVEGWEPELEGREDLPIFITHGARDVVIELGFAQQARENFEEAGMTIDWFEHPDGHHLDGNAFPPMKTWVKNSVPSVEGDD